MKKAKKSAAIVSITKDEGLLYKLHLSVATPNEYKEMIDKMLAEEDNEKAKYVSFEVIKSKFPEA